MYNIFFFSSERGTSSPSSLFQAVEAFENSLSCLDSYNNLNRINCFCTDYMDFISLRVLNNCEHNHNMDTDYLTVQVLNLSPRVTLTDLITFFSYCGTVHNVQLLRDKEKSPYALVTFGQPYAFQTALLLDDAMFGGNPICILPACVIKIPIESDEDIDESQSKSQGHNISVNKTMERMATSKGLEVMLKESRDELEDSLKLSAEKGRKVVMEQARSAIYAVEQAAGRMGSAIMNNNFMSNVIDKASRSASDFGNRKMQ